MRIFYYLGIIDQEHLAVACTVLNAIFREHIFLPKISASNNWQLKNRYEINLQQRLLKELEREFKLPLQNIFARGTWQITASTGAPSALSWARLNELQVNQLGPCQQLYRLLWQLLNLTGHNKIHALLNQLYTALNNPNQQNISIIDLGDSQDSIGRQVDTLFLLCSYFNQFALAQQKYSEYIKEPKQWLDLAARFGSIELFTHVMRLVPNGSVVSSFSSLAITPVAKPINAGPDETTFRCAVQSGNVQLARMVLGYMERFPGEKLKVIDQGHIQEAFSSRKPAMMKYIIYLAYFFFKQSIPPHFMSSLNVLATEDDIKQFLWWYIKKYRDFLPRNFYDNFYYSLEYERITVDGSQDSAFNQLMMYPSYAQPDYPTYESEGYPFHFPQHGF